MASMDGTNGLNARHPSTQTILFSELSSRKIVPHRRFKDQLIKTLLKTNLCGYFGEGSSITDQLRKSSPQKSILHKHKNTNRRDEENSKKSQSSPSPKSSRRAKRCLRMSLHIQHRTHFTQKEMLMSNSNT